MKKHTDLSVLDDETIVDTWLEHLEHLGILHVVANVLQNVAIGDDAESTEDDPDGNVDLNVWDRSFHDITQLYE